jgi:hypothetical protein
VKAPRLVAHSRNDAARDCSLFAKNRRAPASRLRLAGLLLATLVFGIVTRRVHLGVMAWDKSAGDALYAAAVYFAIAFVFPRAGLLTVALLALIYCFGIELFQLTGIPVTLARSRPWVHWLLGSTFAWHDVVCYALGIPLAAVVDRVTESAIERPAAR